MLQKRSSYRSLKQLLCLTACSLLMAVPAHAQIHAPNFQLGLPLGADDSMSELHSDRTPELHINWLFKQGKVDEGLRVLDELLQSQPNRPVLWLMRAYGHELQGKYAEALQDFEKAQKQCAPELATDRRMSLNLLLFKGIALNKVGKNQLALECFNKVIDEGGDPSAYYARGLVYQDLLQNEKAVENFTEALKTNPNNAAWLEGRAFSYCTMGDFSKALIDCNKAIEASPNHLAFETRAWAHHGLREYEKSIEDTDKALQLAPESAIGYWRRGLAHLAQNKSKEAIADFDKGMEIRPSSLLLRDKALAEVDLHEYDKAVKDATDAMSELSKEAQPYRIRALAQYARGDYKKALADWNTAIRLEPDDPYTYARRGNSYLAIGDWEKGLADFAMAEKRSPQLKLHAEKSRAYRHMKKFAEALAECDAAIKENPKDEAAYEARARVHLAQWKNDEALKDADTAIGIADDPKWVSPFEVKALVYSQREQWAKEAAECDKSIAANPEEAAMYVHRAYADHRLGDFKKAISDLDNAIRLEPTADNYAARADANLYVSNFAAAIADANEAIKKDPESSYGFMARGAAQGRQGDKEKMARDFATGLKLDKEPAYAHATVAEYYMDLGLNSDALKEYTAAIAAEPDNGQLYRWRGQAYLGNGNYQEALADFDKAIAIEPMYPVAHAFRAETYVKLGQTDKAIADCNTAIEQDKSCGLAYTNRAMAYERLGKGAEAAADRELAAKVGK
jgi:tetratricopeptide (TPR) repeat protein